MIDIVTASISGSNSQVFDLVVISIGCFLTALLIASSMMMRRVRTEEGDQINPLDRDFRSNIMRAYRDSSKLKWPFYWAIGLVILGIVLVVIAGILQLLR